MELENLLNDESAYKAFAKDVHNRVERFAQLDSAQQEALKADVTLINQVNKQIIEQTKPRQQQEAKKQEDFPRKSLSKKPKCWGIYANGVNRTTGWTYDHYLNLSENDQAIRRLFG
jgi:hypothetical protein